MSACVLSVIETQCLPTRPQYLYRVDITCADKEESEAQTRGAQSIGEAHLAAAADADDEAAADADALLLLAAVAFGLLRTITTVLLLVMPNKKSSGQDSQKSPHNGGQQAPCHRLVICPHTHLHHIHRDVGGSSYSTVPPPNTNGVLRSPLQQEFRTKMRISKKTEV